MATEDADLLDDNVRVPRGRARGGGIHRVAKRYNYQTIADILGRQGATDPRLFNRQLADQDIQNQMMQRQAMGQLGQAGLQGSVGGNALLTALMQGGAQTRADTFAREAALQEQRKREDIINLLFGPKFQRRGLRNQLRLGQIQANANQGGGFDYGSALSGGADIASMFGKGGAFGS